VKPAAGSRAFYGWKLVAACWLIMAINLALPMYGLSFLNVHMADEFQFSRTTLGLAYSAFMVMTGLPGPLVAQLINRVGIRHTLIIGNLVLVSGAVAMATVVNSPLLLLIFGGFVIGASDAIGGPIPVQAAITFWFVRRRSLALALILSGGSIGGMIAPPVLEHVVSLSGGEWRYGWWLIAAMGLVAVAISFAFVRDRPEALGQTPDGVPLAATRGPKAQTATPVAAPRVYVTAERWAFRQVLRAPAFWLVMACATGFSAAFTIFLAQGVLQMRDLGYSTETAAYLLSAAVGIGLVAHMATGFLGDRIDPKLLSVAALLCQATGIALFAHASHAWLLYASVVCLGIGGSSSMVCMVTLLGNWFGPRAYASVFGLASAVQSTLGAAAPIIAGYWYDRSGSFAPVFYTTAAICAAGGLTLLTLRPPRLGESPRSTPTKAARGPTI
jgi:MFS family permease